MSTLCKYKDVEIIAGVLCIVHVYLSETIPLELLVSNLMEYLKTH
ncbi:MAG: hypothetical protein ACI4EF_04960 [Coprococcus sp.]